jgi:phosphate:Na+ symporter
MNNIGSLELTTLITTLVGGLALFLFGMQQMTDALKAVGGSGMKKLLARLTRNRFTAAFAGTVITAIIQSSSVTTVLVVGFISAGLLNFTSSVGVIIGANIGTTITAQIIAFKVTQYSLLIVAAGFLLNLIGSQKTKSIKHYGLVLIGLGLIFLGMNTMSEATRPLRDYAPFIELMQTLRSPLAGIAVAAGFTALVQSSSATTGIVIVLASQGFITLDAGIALIFGANIGTCVTALISSIGKPRDALKAAVVHVLFNVAGVALWLAFIPELAQTVRHFSPAATGLTGTALLAAETPRQIANAHTAFNLINAFLFIGFTRQLAWLAEKIVPAQKQTNLIAPEATPLFIKDYYLEHPAQAVDQAWMETARMAGQVNRMVTAGLNAFLLNQHEPLRQLRKADHQIDHLHGEIIRYLGEVTRKSVDASTSQRIYDCQSSANYWENLADVIETEFVADTDKIKKEELNISPETVQRLEPIVAHIQKTGERVLSAFAGKITLTEGDLEASKTEFLRLTGSARQHLSERLIADAPSRLQHYRLEMDVLEHLTRIHTLYRRIAKICTRSTEPPENAQS